MILTNKENEFSDRIKKVAKQLNLSVDLVDNVIKTHAKYIKDAMESDTVFTLCIGEFGRFKRKHNVKNRLVLNDFDKLMVREKDILINKKYKHGN